MHMLCVCARSLGCRLVLDALPLLTESERPTEVHLCAAAVTTAHAAPSLAAGGSAKGFMPGDCWDYLESLVVAIASGAKSEMARRRV